MIPPFEHADVIAGQGTCGLEILDQLPEVATILVRWAAAASSPASPPRLPALKPSVRVIGVERPAPPSSPPLSPRIIRSP
jgi:threonine dehydratase